MTAGLAAAKEISKDAAVLPKTTEEEQRVAAVALLSVWTRKSDSRLNWQSDVWLVRLDVTDRRLIQSTAKFHFLLAPYQMDT